MFYNIEGVVLVYISLDMITLYHESTVYTAVTDATTFITCYTYTVLSITNYLYMNICVLLVSLTFFCINVYHGDTYLLLL